MNLKTHELKTHQLMNSKTRELKNSRTQKLINYNNIK